MFPSSQHPGPLVAYYDFEGDVLDNSSNGNNGTINGAATYVSTTPTPLASSTQSIRFDAIGEYVEVAHSSSLAFSGGQVTVSVWLDADSSPAWGKVISKGFHLQENNNTGNGNLRVDTTGAGGQNNQSPGGSASLGAAFNDASGWNHVVFTLSNGLFNSWLNGTQVITDAAYNHGTGGFSTTSVLRMGTANYSANDEFIGHVDDVAIWDEALGQSAVTALFNGTSPTAIPEPCAALLGGLSLLGLLRRRRS